MESLRIIQQRALRQVLQSRPSALSQSFRQISQSSQQPFRTRPSPLATLSRTTRTLPKPQFAQRVRNAGPKTSRRFQSTATNTGSASSSGDANLSLSQRLKKLSREYGWSALGVYLLLTALDFPFCFLAVKLLGTDRIGHWEHVVLGYIKGVVRWPLPEAARQQIDGAAEEVEEAVAVQAKEKVPVQELRESGEKRILEEEETYVVEDHGYRQAEDAAGKADASLWTQLLLAYAIHKSFIFIRVPLTAAVTPKVVKTLRGWGWNIGKMPKKKPAAVGSGSGVNTKGSGVKSD